MKKEYPLNISVVLSEASGFVVKACCYCTGKHGHCVTEQSTSKPYVWNRGKKKANNPNTVNETNYKSRKLSDGRVYHRDPRPKEHRGEVTSQESNNFIVDLLP